MVYELVAGWTSVIDISLLTQGESPAGTMAAMSAELILSEHRTGALIDTTGDVSIPNTSIWSVRYSPDSADLAAGVYRMRVKVTDSGGKVAYWPSGDPDWLVVHPEI